MKHALDSDGQPLKQKSVEWMQARAGIPTASEFDALVTPEWKIRDRQMPETYMDKKLAEWWLGGPLPGFNTFDMEQGSILEEEARPWFEWEYQKKVDEVGLILTNDGKVGCSPDGLIGDDAGIEIKCPEPHTHVGYLRRGEVPKDYVAQVHGSMFVTRRPYWYFLSYRRNFPQLVLKVERDDKIQAVLAEALGAWLEKFEQGKKVLCERNGGPPARKPFQYPPLPKIEPQFESVLPT